MYESSRINQKPCKIIKRTEEAAVKLRVRTSYNCSNLKQFHLKSQYFTAIALQDEHFLLFSVPTRLDGYETEKPCFKIKQMYEKFTHIYTFCSKFPALEL